MAHENGNHRRTEAEEKYLEELVRRYGEEEARRILDLQKAETISESHNRPDRGVPTANAHKVPHRYGRRQGPEQPRSVGDDADRHAVGHQKTAEEARSKGRTECHGPDREKHAAHGEHSKS